MKVHAPDYSDKASKVSHNQANYAMHALSTIENHSFENEINYVVK